MNRFLLALTLSLVTALAAYAGSASAHMSGCHSGHSCPSDHHTYVWYDSAGQGWSCASPSASEYDPSRDTTTITYDGYTYHCYAVGSAPAPQPTDSDGDGVPDSSDACPSTFAQTANGCPAPAAPADSDADGVADSADACPTTFAQTANGCPATTTTTTAPCKVDGALPDPKCTPGAALRVTARQVCKRGYSKRVRNVSESLKDQVYARYGVTSHTAATYEVDHLIPLELGGSNSIKNLFPEAATPRPGFHEKDKLENRLHALVCGGKMKLRTAQRQIAKNWLKAYRRLFG